MIVSAAWILPAIFAVINRFAQPRLQGCEPATASDLISEDDDSFLYAFLTPRVIAESTRRPLTRQILQERIILHLLFYVLFCVAKESCAQVQRLVPILT